MTGIDGDYVTGALSETPLRRSDMNNRKELWEEAVRFHGHSCPGLAIGVRVALDFREELDLADRAGDEELTAIVETDACGVDGIQVILGCTAGKGNLWLRKRGKHVFTLYRRTDGYGWRYCWHGSVTGDMSREEKIDYFLNGPPEALYTAGPARYPMPPEAPRLNSVNCQVCGESTAEPNLRVRDGRMICLDCAGLPLDLSHRIEL